MLKDALDWSFAITAKHSLLVDCYCMVDGLKLYLQQAGDSIIQSHFYNGWKHDQYVTNIFAFAPNGSIITCTLNAPGTWHDSTLHCNRDPPLISIFHPKKN